jgi:hypothetical protein
VCTPAGAISIADPSRCARTYALCLRLFVSLDDQEVSEIMKIKMQFVSLALALFLLSVAGTARVSAQAQHSHDHGGQSWKKGMIRLTGTAWAGNVRLKSGMYHVKHVEAGNKHWLVFTSVALAGGFREGSMWEEKEVARLECSVEPVTKSVRNTKVIFARTSASESIQEIQIAGEKVKHILLPQALAVEDAKSF